MNKKLIEAAKIEAANLRKHATVEERDKLNLAGFHPGVVNSCIYGQMTGACTTSRAIELILLCAPMVYYTSISRYGRRRAKRLLPTSRNVSGRRYSPIETLIYDDWKYHNGKRNKAIIAYLKGETDTLDI